MNLGLKSFTAVFIAVALSAQCGCAVGDTKKIALGMLAGAAVGAVAGHEFVHHGAHKEYETRNTVISAVIFSLATGAIMAWHYNALQEQQVEISGRYARYRLCNPDEMEPELARKLGLNGDQSATQLQPGQIGKSAITLDDNTKWVYPVFRKRFLQPEREEAQVLSSRYIWEILKQGAFVTRSQDPQYFYEEKAK